MAKILIVDDELQILQLLSIVLARAGHEVHTTGSPREALEMCGATASFDLVLTDVDMPVMNGHELVRWIAARNPGIRVMLMSAFDCQCAASPDSPPCDLIRKPFVPAEVVRRIAQRLAQTVK